jgi:hypothetical protein
MAEETEIQTEDVVPAEGAEATTPETETEETVSASETETDTPEATTKGEESTETQEAKPETETEETSEPKPADAPEVVQARKMVAAANRKERKALDALKTARQYEEGAKAWDQFRALLKSDPRAAFAAAGFDDEAATRLIAETPDPTDRVTQLENQLKRQEQERVQAAQLARIEEMKGVVRQKVEAQADRFDLVNSFGQHDEVWDRMVAYHDLHGEVPEGLEAVIAAELEAELEAAVSKSKKFARAGSKATNSNDKPTAMKGSASAAKPKTTTLTNFGSSRSPVKTEDLPLDSKARLEILQKQYGFLD